MLLNNPAAATRALNSRSATSDAVRAPETSGIIDGLVVAPSGSPVPIGHGKGQDPPQNCDDAMKDLENHESLDEASERLKVYCSLNPESCTDDFVRFIDKSSAENCCLWREAYSACVDECDSPLSCMDHGPSDACWDTDCGSS